MAKNQLTGSQYIIFFFCKPPKNNNTLLMNYDLQATHIWICGSYSEISEIWIPDCMITMETHTNITWA